MKKIVLSTVAITVLAITGANADSASDIAEMKAMMKQMNQRLAKLEQENLQLKSQAKKAKSTKHSKKSSSHVAKKEVTNEETSVHVEKFAKATVVKSKVPVLKFSGKHYLGFVSDVEKEENKFETRRNYFQVKGYLGEDSKDYFRVTLDTHHDDDGSWIARLKYAYLYLDNILPFTGVEIGQAHRPWIDYEEHHGWYYRSISKVLVEDKHAAHFTNSADLGVNFKTKTEYFSSELGVYNGEGYHGNTDHNTDLSGEWRLTGHIFGTGKKHVHKSDTYADLSFFGQYNTNYKETTSNGPKADFVWYGMHAVYNQPEFLLAAQYVEATDGGVDKEGNGWSVNGEFRLQTLSESMDGWNILGRYDYFELDSGEERERSIAGLAYKYNKYVEFIANYMNEQTDGDTQTDAFMLTTEVNW